MIFQKSLNEKYYGKWILTLILAEKLKSSSQTSSSILAKQDSSNINSKSKNSNNNNNNNDKNYIANNQKTIFVTNFHQSVTVDDLYELFGLRSTNYLRNNCHIEIDHFSNVDQPFASATVFAPAHVCEELLKLHGIGFHDNLLVIEMSKSPIEQSNQILCYLLIVYQKLWGVKLLKVERYT